MKREQIECDLTPRCDTPVSQVRRRILSPKPSDPEDLARMLELAADEPLESPAPTQPRCAAFFAAEGRSQLPGEGGNADEEEDIMSHYYFRGK